MRQDFERFSAALDRAERAEFVPFLHELAAVSAAVIRPYYAQGTAVELKGDNTPVTAADRRAEEVMRLLITQRYADHGILGEEFGLHTAEARYRWVLDPIDGTKAFVSNCYIFGTLISLLRARLYRTWGDCHGYFQVATGGADLMFDPVLKPWDICALVPVIEGAGGRATGLDGGNPLTASNLLVSGGGALHDDVLRAFAVL